jgi:hypothetical protein
MATRRRIQLDVLLHDITMVAFAMLAGWSLIGLYGTLGGYLDVDKLATLRFLFVVLVLANAHHFVTRYREWRMRNMPPDERYGFAGAGHAADIATGSQQAEG